MALLWARFLPAAQAMRRQGRVGLFAARLAADAAGGANAGLSRGHRRRAAPGASSVARRVGLAPLPAVEFCLMTGRSQKGCMLDAARGAMRDARRDPHRMIPTFRFFRNLFVPSSRLSLLKSNEWPKHGRIRPRQGGREGFPTEFQNALFDASVEYCRESFPARRCAHSGRVCLVGPSSCPFA